MDNHARTGTCRRAGDVLIFASGLAVMMSSIVKFAGLQGVVHAMAAEGFSDGKLTLVAVLEIVSAALFLYRRTRSFGVLMLSSFLGGAICTHVQMGAYAKAIGPFVLLILVWIGTCLRHPQALWRPDAGDTADGPLTVENGRESWASKSA
ncbi:MAG TPA: DoxX family protein [Terriglobales bacterium]